MNKIILASASPRRIEMMKAHGYNPTIMPANVDETLPNSISASDAVMYLAEKKGKYIADLLESKPEYAGDYVIAADTVVVLNGNILGKPEDRNDAHKMISSLAGGGHYVMSGVAILQVGTDYRNVFYDSTKVNVKSMTEEEINAYLDTDEPYDKAGAYAIQGIFSKHIENYEGSFDNVVGFPWEKIVKNMPKDVQKI